MFWAAQGFLSMYRGNYQEEKSQVSHLFNALLDAHEVVRDTSQGSFYHTIMELAGLKERYEGKFRKIWGDAKEVKLEALRERPDIIANPLGRRDVPIIPLLE